jgi:hypothetical protein
LAVGSVTGGAARAGAWKSIPSWYVVSTQHHTINPELERLVARTTKAQITELKASHLSFISQPGNVTGIIETAVVATAN